MRTALLLNTAALAFASAAEATATARVAPELTPVLSGLKLPEKTTNRGSKSAYSDNFAALTEVGMYFGVKNKTDKELVSIVGNANRKAKVDKTDDAGNTVYKTQTLTAPDGTKTVVPTQEPEKVATAHYIVVPVDADIKKQIKGTAAEGSTALIYRDK